MKADTKLIEQLRDALDDAMVEADELANEGFPYPAWYERARRALAAWADANPATKKEKVRK